MFKFKHFLTLILTAVIIVSNMSLPITAALKDDSDIVSPMYTNVQSVKVEVTKSSSKVVITIKVTGYSGTTFSNGSVRLLKTSGSNTGLVTRWDRLSSSSSVFTFTDNSTTAESGSYQVNFSIKAVKNGVVESISTSDTV